MKAALIIGVAALFVLGVSSPVLADPISGEVEEIIIKIKTKDGEKWYKLGKNLKPINIREGDYVRFDYADDTIESIVPETLEETEGPAEKSE